MVVWILLAGESVRANNVSSAKTVVYSLREAILRNVWRIVSCGFENGFWKDKLLRPLVAIVGYPSIHSSVYFTPFLKDHLKSKFLNGRKSTFALTRLILSASVQCAIKIMKMDTLS